MINEKLFTSLKMLSDGSFYSGDDLGIALGIGRSAVWKQLKKLEAYGIQVDSVKGRGYCIPSGVDLLSIDSLFKNIDSSLLQKSDVFILPEVDSTNQFLLSRLSVEERNFPVLCACEIQTAGKGRRGREWFSGFASSLCFSLSWRFLGAAQVIEGLSLAIGLGVVKAIESLGVTGLSLKWPNDILYQGRKLAGILIEMQGDLDGPLDVVIGIGINVYSRSDSRIDQDWVALQDFADLQFSRSELLASILNHLLEVLETYEYSGFKAYKEEWMQYDAFQGRAVNLVMGPRTQSGRVQGVDHTGALLLETDGTLIAFSGGEISMRAQHVS